MGLSPRLRGNGESGVMLGHGLRSIPALAGERFLRSHCVRAIRVYPRACGGTLESEGNRWQSLGLSPRLRGNGQADHLGKE